MLYLQKARHDKLSHRAKLKKKIKAQAEISKFGGMLEKAQKQVQQADATLSNLAGTRLNALNRKLRSFDTLPEKDAEHILGLVDATDQAL